MKLVLKGVQTAADAVLAVNAGVDGIVCSNHGGRQQDTARSGLEVLSEVMPALRKTFTSARLVRHVYFHPADNSPVLSLQFVPSSCRIALRCCVMAGCDEGLTSSKR
eukprot:SAG31_NODE_1468_length_8223_cov_37.850320_8_plen_107_part_00